MKKIVIITVVLILFIIVMVNFSFLKVKNVESIYIKYQYVNSSTYEKLNENELKIVEKIFNNKIMYKDGLVCGFSNNIAFEINTKDSKIILAIAGDGCLKLKDLNSGKFISINKDDQEELKEIYEKYNMKFPAI